MKSVFIHQVPFSEIIPLRHLYLQENNFQIRYNARHERGWTDSYMITLQDHPIGYGSIAGTHDLKDRDTLFEFYILPPFRHLTTTVFRELLTITPATYIESQTNDVFFTNLLFQFGKNIVADALLFKEGFTSSLQVDGAVVRKRLTEDRIFEHYAEPQGDYVVVLHQQVVGTGGFLLHYNFPFADLYMEVKEEFRRQGLGSFLIQELKKECYLAGRVPAARTGINNFASKATLMKAGLEIAGAVILGEVAR